MSASLTRVAEISSALAETKFAEAASRDYQIAYQAAHSHPRKSGTVRNAFRRLRNMAREAGIWEQLKAGA